MDLSNHTLQELTKLIHRLSGLSLSGDKAYLVRHRLAPLVRSHGMAGYDEFLKRLRGRGAAALQEAVVDAITTKETSFFRDPWLFDTFRTIVLPALAAGLKKPGGRHRVRIWSAGTSTGQEAYSLAILVRELVDSSRRGLDDTHFSIVASDISSAAIDTAREGLYFGAEVNRGITDPHLRRYLKRVGDRWSISDPVRRLVQFRTFNLLEAPTELGSFDLILCRNVMIYFDEPTRKRVCRGLQAALQPGGWLALGSAESLYGVENELKAVKHGRAVLYQKATGGG